MACLNGRRCCGCSTRSRRRRAIHLIGIEASACPQLFGVCYGSKSRKTMIRQAAIALALLAGSLGAAAAGEIEDLGRPAEKHASAGQHLEAIETLRRAINVLAAKGPVLMRKVQFITEPP